MKLPGMIHTRRIRAFDMYIFLFGVSIWFGTLGYGWGYFFAFVAVVIMKTFLTEYNRQQEKANADKLEEIRNIQEAARRAREEILNAQRAEFSRIFEQVFQEAHREHQRKYQAPRIKTASKKKWWEVLGVSERATPEEVKKAHRKLAMLYHPDKTNDNGARMAEINAAKDEADELFRIR